MILLTAILQQTGAEKPNFDPSSCFLQSLSLNDKTLRRTIEKSSNRELRAKKTMSDRIRSGILVLWSRVLLWSRVAAAILEGDAWDERRSTGITIRRSALLPAWAAYVAWGPSLRAQLPEPMRTHFPAMQWIPQAEVKFNCFEEAYQGRKAYLQKHIGDTQTQQVLRREEMRKDRAALPKANTRQRKRKASCNINRMEKRSKLAPMQSSSSNGARY
eukprot:335232-Rhodomonas_salina.1